jgi:hypothetical protein
MVMRVSYENTWGFLTSRAKTFAASGIGPELREQCLIEQCRRACAGGVEYVAKHADSIHEIAYDPELVLGHSGAFRKMKQKWSKKPNGGIVIKAPPPKRQSVIVETMNGFRDENWFSGRLEETYRSVQSCGLQTVQRQCWL